MSVHYKEYNFPDFVTCWEELTEPLIVQNFLEDKRPFEILLSVGALLSYSVFPCQDIYYDTLHARIVAKDFDAKQCSRMNKCSAREYTMFVPAQLLHIWHEQ
jgi:hypothetical protein